MKRNIINLACIRSLLNQFSISKSLPFCLYKFLKFECAGLMTSRARPPHYDVASERGGELMKSLSQHTQTLKIRINKTGGFSKLKIRLVDS
ncbi:hypothetical protein B566_EDAN002021 [Ephemera danica]|nr:hypothetical protein B566_EDAN002021 [Ephemera danica]